MSHEPSQNEPEGGVDGSAWLDDAGSVEPEPLPDCTIGDLSGELEIPEYLETLENLDGS